MTFPIGREKDLENNFTHYLECVHNFSFATKIVYFMPCIILKAMPKHKLKVLVYGYRWNFDFSIKKIRYVEKVRVIERGVIDDD